MMVVTSEVAETSEGVEEGEEIKDLYSDDGGNELVNEINEITSKVISLQRGNNGFGFSIKKVTKPCRTHQLTTIIL